MSTRISLSAACGGFGSLAGAIAGIARNASTLEVLAAVAAGFLLLFVLTLLCTLLDDAIPKRRRRRDFAKFYVPLLLVTLLATAASVPIVLVVVAIVGLPAFTIISTQRLHDLGMGAPNLLLLFIPIVGAVVLLTLLLVEGEVGENRFGEDPIPSPRPGPPIGSGQQALDSRWTDYVLFSFEGRISRATYWKWAAAFLAVQLVLSAASYLLAGFEGLSASGTAWAVLALVPSLSLNVKRAHDTGYSGWVVLFPYGIAAANLWFGANVVPSGPWTLVFPVFAVVAILGTIWYGFAVALGEGEQGSNRFGVEPSSLVPVTRAELRQRTLSQRASARHATSTSAV